MTVGSGLSAQLGFAPETTYGTFVTPTRFLEISKEQLKADVLKMRTRAITDRYQRASRVRTAMKAGAGTIDLDVMNIGHGLLLKHLIGGVATANGSQPGSYVHTITPDAAAMTGLSATVQVGRPDVGGTVHAFNYLGGKVTDWKLSCDLDKNLALTTTWDFKTVETTDALAAVSLPANATPFNFMDGTVTVGGTTRNIQKLEVGSKNAMNVNRRYLGNVKHEPIANGEWGITGQLDLELEGVADYNAFTAGTQAALVVTFSYGQIPTTTLPFLLTISCPLIEFTGDTPVVASSDVLKQPLPFKALYDGTDPALTITYQTSDATP